ncbi:Pyrroline-5-carboxylate reductase [hydrothermal vent metagenome]|uniref:Pyrroline-5-carboxylate reductase n=1 Tax=hydrothermal vent metagenome TaxID=652676 RepID=A0A3B1A6K1_9ZZZZ
MDKNNKIAFLGGGNMARSLISGLLKSGINANQLCVSDPDESHRALLHADFAIATGSSNQEAVSNADIVVFAVKPQVLKKVINELKLEATSNKLFISIAAGIPEPTIQKWLNFDAAIVRCMPNTPALVESGATALFANNKVSTEQHAAAESIMRAVGLTVWLDKESDMDAVTALSGSGPAYFFYVMQAMEQSAIKMGLNPETARILCLQTALGAAKLAIEVKQDPAELRQKVTSPGGTTEAAIEEFDKGAMMELFSRGLFAAQQRAKTLADELGD